MSSIPPPFAPFDAARHTEANGLEKDVADFNRQYELIGAPWDEKPPERLDSISSQASQLRRRIDDFVNTSLGSWEPAFEVFIDHSLALTWKMKVMNDMLSNLKTSGKLASSKYSYPLVLSRSRAKARLRAGYSTPSYLHQDIPVTSKKQVFEQIQSCAQWRERSQGAIARAKQFSNVSPIHLRDERRSLELSQSNCRLRLQIAPSHDAEVRELTLLRVLVGKAKAIEKLCNGNNLRIASACCEAGWLAANAAGHPDPESLKLAGSKMMNFILVELLAHDLGLAAVREAQALQDIIMAENGVPLSGEAQAHALELYNLYPLEFLKDDLMNEADAVTETEQRGLKVTVEDADEDDAEDDLGDEVEEKCFI
ncbi:uncharacterized protein LTR77_005761 [Saxophila tyrrhenica]|uniref:Uncharacterized protein n=1 Tax=Saxophila tyrrhenica TaxID=1690608 RepID=A0AAV9P9U6_9PEZI|nr:hypothetical protein LTR77_005761 [Saxophila tyrrhenica]